MFEATIKSKREVKAGIEFTVEFTDGVKVIEGTVIPSDEDGLTYYVKSELDRLNAAPALDAKYAVGTAINVVKPVIVTEPTPEQLYFTARFELMELKTDMELGLATQADFDAKLAQVIALKPGAVIKK